jgi:hypothetical protein
MTEAHGCGASQCHLRAVTPSGLVALDSYPLTEGDGLRQQWTCYDSIHDGEKVGLIMGSS